MNKLTALKQKENSTYFCVVVFSAELVEKLYGQRQNDGITDYIGKVMVNWVSAFLLAFQ